MARNSAGGTRGLFSQKIERGRREGGRISRDRRAAGDENFGLIFVPFPIATGKTLFHGSNVGLFQGEIKGFQDASLGVEQRFSSPRCRVVSQTLPVNTK